MRFTLEYPIGQHGYSSAFLEPATVTTIAQRAEQLGYGAIAFTEHPAPSKKWMDSGGHESFDPLSALAYCAASTSEIRLMTYLLVLPYRNPLLAAKQIATVDVLSGGRLVVATGGGYLKSEFSALGVDFDERNDLVDEALEVFSKLWLDDEFVFQGLHFRAPGQVSLPAPTQKPHPPLWIGGNSRTARRRVARFGQGWTPLITDEQLSTTTRTASIASVDSLAENISDLRSLVAEAGRDPSAVDVQIQWPLISDLTSPTDQVIELIHQLEAIGVTWIVITPPSGSVNACLEGIEQFITSAKELM